MKILIDGNEILVQNDVKIIWEEVDGADELHVTCTHEGIITDVVADGEIIATRSAQACDIHADIMMDDADDDADVGGENISEFYHGYDEPDTEVETFG